MGSFARTHKRRTWSAHKLPPLRAKGRIVGELSRGGQSKGLQFPTMLNVCAVKREHGLAAEGGCRKLLVFTGKNPEPR